MLPESFGFQMLGVAINYRLHEDRYLLTVKVKGHCRMTSLAIKTAKDAYKLMKIPMFRLMLVEGMMNLVADEPLVSLN